MCIVDVCDALILCWVQVVSSAVGDVADDAAGAQSNSPIAAAPEVEVVDETKFVTFIPLGLRVQTYTLGCLET